MSWHESFCSTCEILNNGTIDQTGHSEQSQKKNGSELGLSGERDKLGQITLNALSVPREWAQVSDIYSLCDCVDIVSDGCYYIRDQLLQ
jgi:hypothetical protein